MNPTPSSDVRQLGSAERPIALVTGGSRRVGLASARTLARHGFDLVLTSRTPEESTTALAELEALGARAAVVPMRLDDLSEVDRVARSLATTLTRLDVLIHNASSYTPTPLESLSPDDLLSAYRVNAGAPLLLSRGLAPMLQRSPRPGGGSIVAMADIHAMGEHGLPRKRDFIAYSMSKAALMEMVRSLARELAPSVRVNAVAPGVVVWPDQGYESDQATQAAYLSKVPLQRAGTPLDAAEAVRWLALDATYVTGQVIRVDGGRNLV